MTKTRMDSRMEQVEKSVMDLEEIVAAIRLGQERMRAEQEQRFNKLEVLIATMVKGKGTAETGDSSSPSPLVQSIMENSVTRETNIPLLLGNTTAVAKKVEMPDFDGTDPVGWVARTEQFFEIQSIPEETKVSLALVSMEGASLRWLHQRNPQLTWNQLREELRERCERGTVMIF